MSKIPKYRFKPRKLRKHYNLKLIEQMLDESWSINQIEKELGYGHNVLRNVLNTHFIITHKLVQRNYRLPVIPPDPETQEQDSLDQKLAP